jgi:hypothetical protein
MRQGGRSIEFDQTVEAAVAQAAEQLSLDDQNRDFDPSGRWAGSSPCPAAGAAVPAGLRYHNKRLSRIARILQKSRISDPGAEIGDGYGSIAIGGSWVSPITW